jgi:anti-sigma B factor antagonist
MKGVRVGYTARRRSGNVHDAVSMTIGIKIDTGPSESRSSLSGEFDLNAEPRVRKALFGILESQPERLVIDLGEVTFIDSTGLRVLLACRNRCAETGTRLLLAGVGPDIERTLQVANLKNFFEYEPRG